MGREIGRDAWRPCAGPKAVPPDDWRTTRPLLSYQGEISHECAEHTVTFVEKSRRTGATFGAAADAVLRSGAEKSAGGMDTLYMGTSADMAREFVDASAGWGAAAGPRHRQPGRDPVRRRVGEGIKATRIDFASGYSIVALPSRPRVLRGRRASSSSTRRPSWTI